MKYAISMILLVCMLALSAQAYTQDELRWEDVTHGTLRYDKFFTGKNADGEYMVKVIDFPPPVKGIKDINGNIVPETPVTPSVMLELYKTTKDGTYLIENFALGDGDYKIVNDEARVVIDEFPNPDSKNWIYETYDPWVTLTLQLIDVPDFEITIDIPKTTFGYDDDLADIGININNTGSYAKNIDVLIDTEGLNLIKGLRKERFSYLDNNDSLTSNISIGIPKILQGSRSYIISVVAAGYDIRGKSFSNSESLKIVVGSDIGPLEVVKFNKSMKDRVYVGDNLYVSLSLTNNGKFNIDTAMVEDIINSTNANLNGKFVLLSNINLKWNTSVLAGNTWTMDYLIKPIQSGKYTFPPARANVSIYGIVYEVKSNTPEIEVFGSRVVISKSATYKEDMLHVNIRMQNTGNIPTTVSVEDKLPENATVTLGNTRLTTFLAASSEKYLSYDAKINSLDNATLPPAIAYFTIGEYKETVVSNTPTVVLFVEPGPKGAEVSDKKLPSPEPDDNRTQFNLEDIGKEKEEKGFLEKYAVPAALIIISVTILYFIRRKK